MSESKYELQQLKAEIEQNHTYIENFIHVFKLRISYSENNANVRVSKFLTSLQQSTCCLMKKETIELLCQFLKEVEIAIQPLEEDPSSLYQTIKKIYQNVLEFNKIDEGSERKSTNERPEQSEMLEGFPVKKIKKGFNLSTLSMSKK